MSALSDRTPESRGKLNPTNFIVMCMRTVFSDKAIHGRWLPAEQLHAYMHIKCNVGDDVKFSFASMMRAVNKAMPLASLAPNTLETRDGLNVNVFRHSFQTRKRRYFFWVTSTVGVVPSTPSVVNVKAWEEDRVLTRLLSDQRCVTTTLIRPMLEEPDPKRQKSASLEQAEEEEVNGQGKTTTANNVEDEAEETFPLQQQSRNVATVDWWQSGDARRLFAPCDKNLLYEANCDVKEVVMKRIELLETVNHASRNWKTVVDTRSHDRGASRFESYSEADIFSLRFRSMFFALDHETICGKCDWRYANTMDLETVLDVCH